MFLLSGIFLKEGMCFTGIKDLEAAVPDSLAQDCVMTSEYMTVIHKCKEQQTYLCFNSICIGKDRCCSSIKGKIQEVNEIIKQAHNSGLQNNLTKIAQSM